MKSLTNLHAVKKSLLYFYFILLTMLGSQTLRAQCSCTNCPQFMPDNFVGDFLISVSGAANPTLGQNGQGVCGVNIFFDHEYLGDLSITLTSPAGQSVQLVGPIGLFGPTDGTTWNISFVPCGDPANPDPGFAANWNNNQAWGMFGNYAGSYYPFAGCLENFNFGSVNGTWTLTVVDGQAVDVGNFFDYEIIFCDPTGINCFSCDAEAGNLLQANVSACEGDPSLNLNLPPTYSANEPAPPVPDYSYTYVISGLGGIIQEYNPSPNLTGYPAGSYTICGLSYYTTQAGDIPPPNGSLTTAQLAAMLNSGTPPFCGDLTQNCVDVTINPVPPNEQEQVTICAPNCYTYYNETYCQTGVYTQTVTDVNGCQFQATLNLTVIQPVTVNLFESICAGECSNTPGFGFACDAGQYTQVFNSVITGCDSIVTLNVAVPQTIPVIQTPGEVPCDSTPIFLSGVGSTVGPGVTYEWTASNGGNIIGNPFAINTLINAPGTYQLKVCNTIGLTTCCDSTSTLVFQEQGTIDSPSLIAGDSTPCLGTPFTLSVPLINNASEYHWLIPSGLATINGASNGPSVDLTWNLNNPGSVCVYASNNCAVSDTLCVLIQPDSLPPEPLASGPNDLCSDTTVMYTAVGNGGNYVWSITGPGTIVSGQNTANLEVNWSGSGSGEICLVESNDCGDSDPSCIQVNLGGGPVPPAITGPDSSCIGASVVYISPPGAPTYNWEITNGTIMAGMGTNTVMVQWDGNGELCLSTQNLCLTSDTVCLQVVAGAPPPTPVVSGPDTLCSGITAIYTTSPVSGATDYTWTIPVNGTIQSGQGTTSIEVLWDSSGLGNVCVSALSSCGAGPDGCMEVNILEIPIADAGPDQTLCGSESQFTANLPLGLSGSWNQISGPGMAQISEPFNPASSVSGSPPGMYTFGWTLDNGFCSDEDSIDLVFNEIPNLQLITESCDSTNTNYTVTLNINGGVPPFSINGTPVAGSPFISPSIPSGTPASFVAIDSNLCVSDTLEVIFNCQCTTDAGSMAPDTLETCGMNTVTGSTVLGPNLDGNDILSFVLHDGSGSVLGAIFSQNVTGEFGIEMGMNFGQVYYISAVAGDELAGLTDLSDPCLSVAPGQPVVFYEYPDAMAGADDGICGLGISLAAGNASGTWTVIGSPAGSSPELNTPGSPDAQLTSDLPGLYELEWNVTENGCSDVDTVVLELYPVPGISPVLFDCDSTNEFYTLQFDILDGTPGFTVNGSAIAGSTFTSNLLPSGDPFSFTISDSNNCTIGPFTESFTCQCATHAGTIDQTVLEVCALDSLQVTGAGDATLDGNDILVYVLHDNSGPSLGQIFAENTSGIFGLMPGMNFNQTYYISTVAGNELNGLYDPTDPCLDVSIGQPVIFREIPTPNAGMDSLFCGQEGTLLAQLGITGGTWMNISGPGSVQIQSPDQPGSQVIVSQSGTYEFTYTEDNFGCIASDSVLITFAELPVVGVADELCNGTNTAYQVEFQPSGGAAPYSVNGLTGSFNGLVFSSDFLPNGTPYSFTIIDSNGCESSAFDGNHACDCATTAGSMVTDTVRLCDGDLATAIWNNDASLDLDDTLYYVLHDQPGNALGNILAVGTLPEFNILPGMQTDQLYYISALAVSAPGGVPDLSDPCLSLSPGTPVMWKTLPDASIDGSTSLCLGETTEIDLNGSGHFPLSLIIDNSNGSSDTLILSSGSDTWTIEPALSTDYTLSGVFDGTLPVCAQSLNNTVSVQVSQPVEAGTQGMPFEACAEDGSLIQLTGLLSGADGGGVWTETSAIPSSGNAFDPSSGTFNNLGQNAGIYTFQYTVSADPPCPDDDTELTLTIHPLPVADAGQDQSLDCSQVSGTIGGQSSSGLDITYLWTLNGDSLSNESTLEVTQSGTYQILVQNGFNCIASDQVDVQVDNLWPDAEFTVTGIRCFGEENGQILLQNIQGVVEPVLTSINGAPFVSQELYTNLGPGNYQIVLQDSRGCEWVSGPIEIASVPELLAELDEKLELRLGEAANVDLNVSVPLNSLDTIIWSPLVDTASAGLPVQEFTPYRSLQLQVEVIDTNGCTAQDQILILVDRERHIYVPNIFNPEQDRLTVFGGQDVVSIEAFSVYDRWGNLVFENADFQPNDPGEGWDGRFKGQDLNPGVYIFTLTALFVDGERVQFSGDITIYR